jgi:hypothetical protein
MSKWQDSMKVFPDDDDFPQKIGVSNVLPTFLHCNAFLQAAKDKRRTSMKLHKL